MSAWKELRNALLIWERVGIDHWVLGVPVRGVVRRKLAEVWFDKDADITDHGGWHWRSGSQYTELYASGWERSRVEAITTVEEKLGIEQDLEEKHEED